jgi:hypothetical protein
MSVKAREAETKDRSREGQEDSNLEPLLPWKGQAQERYDQVKLFFDGQGPGDTQKNCRRIVCLDPSKYSE